MNYQPDYRETARWMRRDDALRSACEAAAEDVAEMAVFIAPIRTGQYVESIQTFPMSGVDRVGAGVEAADEAAAPIEFGNRRMRIGRHVLLTAAQLVGLDVRDE